MKNWQVNILFLILLCESSFAQQTRNSRPNDPSVGQASTYQAPNGSLKIISWQTPKLQDVLGLGNRLFLCFNKAEYDLNKHFLPIYAERIALPFGASSANVQLFNEKYIPLSD